MKLDYLGVTQLRYMTAQRLAEMERPALVVNRSQPIACLVPYATFLSWQTALNLIDKAASGHGTTGSAP